MNPGSGRFTQQDTWSGFREAPITLNKYLYGDSDSVNHVDPSGHMSMMDVTLGPSLGHNVQTTSTATTFSTVTRMAVRLLLAVGTAAIPGSTVLNNEESRRQARQEQERMILVAAAVSSVRSLLFHYADPLAAAEIWGCKCINASATYYGHINQGDGLIRPSGAYATPIPPWHPTMTQRDLASFIYLKPRMNRSVESAVVIRNNGDWRAWTGIEWIKRGPPGANIPVDAVMVTPNLMNR